MPDDTARAITTQHEMIAYIVHTSTVDGRATPTGFYLATEVAATYSLDDFYFVDPQPEHLLRRPSCGADLEFDAYTDVQSIAEHFEELDRRYPTAAFVLTVRELDDWLANSTSLTFKR